MNKQRDERGPAVNQLAACARAGPSGLDARPREAAAAWSIPTTSRPISIAGRDPICKPTARTATSSTRAARPTSRWDSTCRSTQTKTVGVRPIQGTFNIAGARIIAPGDPAGSVLVLPHLEARRRPDAAGRLEPGRRASDPDDPRLDRRNARTRRSRRRRADRACVGRGSRCARVAAQPIGSAPTRRTAAIRRLASTTRGALDAARPDRSRTDGPRRCSARWSRSRGTARRSKSATCSSGSFPRKSGSSGWAT